MKTKPVSDYVGIGAIIAIVAFSFTGMPKAENPGGETILIPKTSLMPIGWPGMLQTDSATNNSAYVAVPKASLMPAPGLGTSKTEAVPARMKSSENQND